MRRVAAACINHNLPTGGALLQGWQASAIAYREMMTAPVPDPEPVGQPTAIAPRRPALVPA